MDQPLYPALFKIYRSSAGSGKTYRLTLEYLKLALRYPEYYKRILAVTFTNKAANEMKTRMLENLHVLATGQAPGEYVSQLCDALQVDENLLRDRAAETLMNILHGYGYFSVGTIDSFFQRIITAFARDIGLQGGFSLEFDLDSVTEEVIDELYMELEEDRQLLRWLTRFTETRIEDNRGWDIRHEIRDLTRQVFNDHFIRYQEALGPALEDKDKLGEVLKEIEQERAIFRHRMQQLAENGLEILNRHQLDVDDISRKRSGPAGFLLKWSEQMDPGINSYQQAAYEQTEAWITRQSDRKAEIMAALEDGLFELYRKMIDDYERNIRDQHTYSLILKRFYHLGIYSHLIRQLARYREEHDSILISDLSRLLGVIIGENDAPYIYEKAGSFYQHFLIDEFQDTSTYQWNNFKPLILNAIAMGQFNMLVGDVKQSIYRWRGGDWRILQEEAAREIGPDIVEMEPLSINWRSYVRIVRFNNAVFTNIPDVIIKRFNQQLDGLRPEYADRLRPYADIFHSVYDQADQKLPPGKMRKEGGLVQVRFFEKAKDEDVARFEEKVMVAVTEKLREIQDRGYRLKDIAVLVRSRSEGKKIADHLLSLSQQKDHGRYRYDVVSSESLFLDSSHAVRAVINCMQLVLNPDDRLARINLYYRLTLLTGHYPGIPLEGIIASIQDPAREKELKAQVTGNSGPIAFRSLRTLPLEDLLEVIVQELGLDRFEGEQTYLLGLQHVILEYREKQQGSLHAFIEWWEKEGGKQSIKPSEDQDAIRVMTIHQAKGLEFEMVLVPFCSWDLDHLPNTEVIWCHSDRGQLGTLPFYPVRYEKALAHTHFDRAYFEEMSLAYMDNLNLLYVTLTRAVQGLFLFARVSANPGQIRDVGELLHEVIVKQAEDREDGENANEVSFHQHWNEEKQEFTWGEITPAEAGGISGLFDLSVYPTGKWYDKISIRKQPDFFSREEGWITPSERVNTGILLHDILSRIIRQQDMEQVLDEEERSGRLQPEDRQRIAGLLLDLWKDPKIADWFSGHWDVRTEVPVLPRSGEMSRMDRVMIRDNQAIVIDYKTGSPRREDKAQVSAYRRILLEMGYDPVEGYLLYLADRQLIEV